MEQENHDEENHGGKIGREREGSGEKMKRTKRRKSETR